MRPFFSIAILFIGTVSNPEQLVGTTRIVCRAGSVTVGRPSVHSGHHTPLLRVCGCGSGRQQILTDCCTVGAQEQRQPNAGSAVLSADVGSCRVDRCVSSWRSRWFLARSRAGTGGRAVPLSTLACWTWSASGSASWPRRRRVTGSTRGPARC